MRKISHERAVLLEEFYSKVGEDIDVIEHVVEEEKKLSERSPERPKEVLKGKQKGSLE